MIETLKHPARFARRMYRSPVFWLAVATLCLLYAVWQSDKERPLVVRNAQVQFCNQVTRPGSIAAAERDKAIADIDRDLARFARAAEIARRADGNKRAANVYAQVVQHSRLRLVEAKKREAAARARASVPCADRFPRP